MPVCSFSIPCSSACEDPVACAATAALSIANQFGNAISAGCPPGPLGAPNNGTAVQGSATGGIGVLGTSSNGIGVVGQGARAGVQGLQDLDVGPAGWFEVSTQAGGPLNPAVAVLAKTDGRGNAVEGFVEPTGTGSAGFFHVENPGSSQPALNVTCINGPGITAASQNDVGVFGSSTNLIGVAGISQNSDAGLFIGNVTITGTLNATHKNFVIDHPLDPANRQLVHASVESSEMATLYSGNVILDSNGEAWVELPDWLEALNSDFRYQLTCVGRSAPVYIAEEVTHNRFRIAGGNAGMKVSWQLTGIRKDPWAQAHPLIADEMKSANERGFYRNPEVYSQPDDKAIQLIWLRSTTKIVP